VPGGIRGRRTRCQRRAYGASRDSTVGLGFVTHGHSG
jgi:hypothetical protein